MAQVDYDSRSRIAIEWYDNEAEADARAAVFREERFESQVAKANIGIVQVGRDSSFDKDGPDGQRQYAVVVP